MKKMKKLLAVTLMVAMVCGVFAVIEPEKADAAMPAPTAEYFQETFSTDGTFENEAWISTTEENLATWKNYVVDGKFTIPSDNATGVHLYVDDDALKELSDYTVTCEIQFDKAPSKDVNIGLVARTNDVQYFGYEFQVTVKTNGKHIARLRNRNGGYYTDSTGELLYDIDWTAKNVLKVQTEGTKINCYVNDIHCIAYDTQDNQYFYDSETEIRTYAAGTTALRVASTAFGANLSIDNYKVYCADNYKFCDDFNGYNGEATNAQKRAALLNNDWWIRTNVLAGMITGDSYIVPATNETNPIVLQAETAKGALGWNDYSVEADVTIGTEGQTLENDVYACVTGRHTEVGGNDGYELQFYCKPDGTKRLRIYGRNAGSTLAQCDFPLEYGRTYNLKAVFQGNTIYAYVDDVLYLTATNDTYPIGFAGIKKNGTSGAACGMDVKFDNFVVYDYDVVPTGFEDDFNVYVPELNSDNLYEMTQLNNKGWKSTANKLLRYSAQYASDGVLKVPATRLTETETETAKQLSSWCMSLSTEDASTYKNCKIECDISFALNSDVTTLKKTYVYIAGRGTTNSAGNVTATTSGYGFYVGTNASAGSSAKIRYVGIVKNGKAVGTENIDLTSANRLSFNEPVTAVLELNERTVKGYIKGHEDTTTVVYTIPEEETITAGYVGMYTYRNDNTTYRDETNFTNHDITIDNFKVYDLDNPYVKEIVGDVKVDNAINKTDVDAIKNRLLKENLTSDSIDVNKDSEKNIYDYVRLMRLLDSMN